MNKDKAYILLVCIGACFFLAIFAITAIASACNTKVSRTTTTTTTPVQVQPEPVGDQLTM